jgi:ornithine cyclodeaminase
MLILNELLVAELATMKECIDVIDVAMRDVARLAFEQPRRQVLGMGKTIFGVMAGTCAAYDCFAAKLISVSETPALPSLASHQGVVVLFDATSGLLTAILDAGAITAMRTAAASAVATRALARPDSRVLTLIGSGHQAHKHLEAIRLVLPIERAIVWSRNIDHAAKFASVHNSGKFPVTVASTVSEAVKQADVICTLTSSVEPLLRGEWLIEGQHINVVGSGIAARREIDEEAVRRARFFADYSDFVREQGGEFLAAIQNRQIAPEHLLGDIGSVLDEQLLGRTGVSDITIYKSLGLISQDMAFARHVARKAAGSSACADVPFAAHAAH